jgi:hypothetical protein
MNDIIADTTQTAVENGTTQQKVLAGVAITAYLGACYAGGYMIGKLIERRAGKSVHSQNNFFDQHVFTSDTSN